MTAPATLRTAANVEPLVVDDAPAPPPYVRHRLPATREGRNYKVRLWDRDPADPTGEGRVPVKFYLRTSVYPDGSLGEIFVTGDRQGERDAATLDVWATACSMDLQAGVPVKILFQKFVGVAFLPDGMTGIPGIPTARSPIDLFARLLLRDYGGDQVPAQEAQP